MPHHSTTIKQATPADQLLTASPSDSHPLTEFLEYAPLVVSKLGHNAWAVIHLLLKGEMPEVPVLLIHLPNFSPSPTKNARRNRGK